MKKELPLIEEQTKTKELEAMLKGLKESLEVFEKANDRESIYATRRHIRTVEDQLCPVCEKIELDEKESYDERQSEKEKRIERLIEENADENS